MLMLATIPMVAAVEIKTTTPPEEGTTDIGSTFIRGIITRPRLVNGGHHIQFRAIYVHYRTRSIGETQYGTLRLFQKLVLNNDFIGFVGKHYVFARFDGKLDV
ncbi:MAG: hypothetical protein QXL17_04765 [Candidatus Thermoplasmatota archaeon]